MDVNISDGRPIDECPPDGIDHRLLLLAVRTSATAWPPHNRRRGDLGRQQPSHVTVYARPTRPYDWEVDG